VLGENKQNKQQFEHRIVAYLEYREDIYHSVTKCITYSWRDQEIYVSLGDMFSLTPSLMVSLQEWRRPQLHCRRNSPGHGSGHQLLSAEIYKY
jgi:hypothetical protein